jgi:hypothetical protein
MTKADGGEPPLTDLLDAINDLLYQLDKASGRVPQYVERAAARVGHAANAAAQADTAPPAADTLARWLQEDIERHPAIQIRRGSQPIAYRAWAVELLARLTKETK